MHEDPQHDTGWRESHHLISCIENSSSLVVRVLAAHMCIVPIFAIITIVKEGDFIFALYSLLFRRLPVGY